MRTIAFTTIEYDALMLAIDTAYEAIENDDLLDPRNEQTRQYTHAQIREALEEAERKINDVVHG